MAILLESGFEILYLSDLKYDEMTVEIQYKGKQVAQLNKDKGINNIEIPIYSEYVILEYLSDLKFPINDFLEAIERAMIALKSA